MSKKEVLLFVTEDRRSFEWIDRLLPNFHVITAASPAEAAYHVRTAAPRFVLADSGVRGLKMLHEITKTASPATMMIVFTRNNRDLKWAREHGMLSIPQRSIPLALSESAETVSGYATTAAFN